MFNKCPLTGDYCLNPKNILVYKVADGHQTNCLICHECTEHSKIPFQEGHHSLAWQKFLTTVFALLGIDKVLSQEELDAALFRIKTKDELNVFLESLVDRKRKTEEIPPCPYCGRSVNELLSTSRMGCQTCYEHFGDFVKAVIVKVQAGAVTHKGKRPKNKVLVDVKAFEVIKKEMEKAIEEERYEDAAKLRDQIRAIRASMSSSTSQDPPVG